MGILFLTLASVFFGCNPSVQQVLLLDGMSADFIAFGTMLGGALFSGIAALLRKESFRVEQSQIGVLLFAGIVGRAVTELALVTAYTMIPAGVATMVHFFFPTLVSVAMVLFFHEKWTWQTGAAIVLSIAGLAGIAGGAPGASVRGVLIAAVSSVSFGSYYIMTERSSLKWLPPMVMIFYLHIIAAAATSLVLSVRGEWVRVTDPVQGMVLAASGLVGFCGYLFLNRGIPMVGAGIAAFINMLEPIVSVLMSVVFFHSRLSLSTILGCTLIVGAMFVRALKTHGGAAKAPEPG